MAQYCVAELTLVLYSKHPLPPILVTYFKRILFLLHITFENEFEPLSLVVLLQLEYLHFLKLDNCGLFHLMILYIATMVVEEWEGECGMVNNFMV